jgi:UDP-2,3-diacylglucosamine pyrophosphatase LpxH
VISDLHLGDGSNRDTFAGNGREKSLYVFLDHVEAEGGELIVAGDLLEMMWWDVDVIVSRYGEVLDRLTEMDAAYVLGNHDAPVARMTEAGELHPFLKKVDEKLIRTIGGKTFKIMHGHEADVLSGKSIVNCDQFLENLPNGCEDSKGGSIISRDELYKLLSRFGEYAQKMLRWVTSSVNARLYDWEHVGCIGKLRGISRTLRTRKMVKRYMGELNQGDYDVAVVGHTHRPGEIGSWYFNSGSWTGPTNNFIRISPCGGVEVFEWSSKGPSILSGAAN